MTAVIAEQDIIITTAAIPGAKSPILVTEDMVKELLKERDIINQNYLNNYSKSFTQAQNNLIESKTSKLQYISKLLESYSYKKTLARGFSVVRTAKGEVISSK